MAGSGSRLLLGLELKAHLGPAGNFIKKTGLRSTRNSSLSRSSRRCFFAVAQFPPSFLTLVAATPPPKPKLEGLEYLREKVVKPGRYSWQLRSTVDTFGFDSLDEALSTYPPPEKARRDTCAQWQMAYEIGSEELADRCQGILQSVSIRCYTEDFDTKLSYKYDPQRHILVLSRDELLNRNTEQRERSRKWQDWRRKAEREAERKLDKEQSNQLQEQPNPSPNGGTPAWINILGGALNRVNRGLGGTVPALEPVGNVRGAWAP
ncbi:MAG: hypothetical protein M1816_004928 [Peltula sp. TS41687]|nr:MAG: hypothetical protein M1816_004928 [Peltula sp. TS41687]